MTAAGGRRAAAADAARLAGMRKRRLAMIHTGKRELGLDEATYRALLERVTGARSAKGLDLDQLRKVVEELRRLGFAPVPRQALGTAQQCMIAALWGELATLGALRDGSARALDKFVERQTGVATLRWLRDERQAAKVIEGLKAWIKRAG